MLGIKCKIENPMRWLSRVVSFVDIKSNRVSELPFPVDEEWRYKRSMV